MKWHKVAARKVLSVVTAAAVAVSPAIAGPALLFDSANGRILYAEDQDDQWFPASLTKIMTAYITFEAIKEGKLQLDTPITCSELASSQGPTKVGMPPGGSMTIETALAALIVKSANDVAVMLAEAISGSHEAFVARMNATAMRLGMTRTRFANANGLPAPEQVTTARDLARLSAALSDARSITACSDFSESVATARFPMKASRMPTPHAITPANNPSLRRSHCGMCHWLPIRPRAMPTSTAMST